MATGEESRRYVYKHPNEYHYNGDMLCRGDYTKEDTLRRVKDFQVRDGDVFLAGYPKSGNIQKQSIGFGISMQCVCQQ